MTTASEIAQQSRPRKHDTVLWAPTATFSVVGTVVSARRDGSAATVDWLPVEGGFTVRSVIRLPNRDADVFGRVA